MKYEISLLVKSIGSTRWQRMHIIVREIKYQNIYAYSNSDMWNVDKRENEETVRQIRG